MLERDIQMQICDYLHFMRGDLFFWRTNTAPIFDANKKVFRAMPKYGITGVPDIIIIKDGKFIGLEVKLPKGKQSDSQKNFQKLLEKAGGTYFLVHSLEETQEVL